jgi:hypothetical protein
VITQNIQRIGQGGLNSVERSYSRNYSILDEPIEVTEEKKVNAPDASNASDASRDNATSSKTTKTVESCNNCNDSSKNIQANDRDIEDIPDKTGVKESVPSQNVSKASNVSEASQESQKVENQSSLKSFGIEDPIHPETEYSKKARTPPFHIFNNIS